MAKNIRRTGIKKLALFLFPLVTLFFSNTLHAGEYEDGIAAYQAGEYDVAISLLAKAGDQGHARAQYFLSVLFEGRSGIKRDASASLHWLEKAAESGFVEAQRNLAAFYHDGVDNPDDDIEQAKFWYRKTASQGDLKGQLYLAILLDKESQIEKDHTEAIRWYLLAARQGVAQAQYNLGLMHDRGRGTPVNPVKALSWLTLAAELRYREAMLTLGDKYARGYGVGQSDFRAYIWYQLAEINGHRSASGKRNATAVKLTLEQVKHAKQRAADWLLIH